MIKRVKPYYRKEWTDQLHMYLEKWDFWKEGALLDLEKRISEFVDRKYGIACNSTTNSIFMCLYIWSKKYPELNEVILPNWGYPAAYKACDVLGLKPIIVDIDRWTLGMTQTGVADVLSNKTLAVVHIENNGIIGDPLSIKEILPEHVLFIEDAAPSLLQEESGTYGDVSMFSFSPTKPFCAGEGSVIITDNKEIEEALRKFRYIGHYTDLTTSLNFAMSALLATYIIPQFDILSEIIDMREWVHKEYKKHLDIFEEPYIETNRHGAIMYLSEKAVDISRSLTNFGIEHRHKYYPNFIDDPIDYPISIEVKNQIIDLPMHQDLTEKDINAICTIIKRVEK